MQAISLWQPWASLIALGIKKHETRSWSTSYRGALAIHAAKRWEYEQQNFLEDILDDYPAIGMTPPRGVMLCICKLTGVYRTQDVARQISADDYYFGDYSPGRFAWRLEVVEVFNPPIPVRGAQGLWNWER